MKRILFLFLLLTSFSFGETQKECLVKWYTSQLGVKELTNHNDGKEVEMYQRSVGLPSNSKAAWCACFTSCGMSYCCIDNPKSALAVAYFNKKTIIWSNDDEDAGITPEQTDLGGIYFASLKGIHHIFFIDEWEEGDEYCTTVEGNSNDTGSREGTTVVRHRRLKEQIRYVARFIKSA